MKHETYKLKIDSCLYLHDKLFVVIRLRNKRYTQKFLINDVICNKKIIEKLHPYDICVLGILHSNQNHFKSNSVYSLPNISNFIKISPCLQLTEVIFDDNNNEIFIIKPNFLNKSIKVSAKEVLQKIELLSGLNVDDTLAIGSTLNYNDIPYTQMTPLINYKFIHLLCMNVILVILSLMFISRKININEFSIDISSILTVIIFYINAFGYVKLKTHYYQINFTTLGAILLLWLYLSIVITLPYEHTNTITTQFNSFFINICSTIPTYTVKFFLVVLLVPYLPVMKINIKMLIIYYTCCSVGMCYLLCFLLY